MNTVLKILDKLKDFTGFDYAGQSPKILQVRRSGDDTVKLLLEFSPGHRVESVIMPFHRRHTVCLSTQVGCAMGCRFCLTGTQGLVRSLSPEEIVSQYLTCYQWIIDDRKIRHIPKPNIVFMGEGEPLHNFDNVKTALDILLSRDGVCLGPRQITLSTVGYLPGLRRLSELPPVNIALSLHSAIPGKRAEIIPLERGHGLQEIIPILKDLPLKKNQYINLEYLLITGFNSSREDALALVELSRELKAIVNIIPYNHIEGLPWEAPGEEDIRAFKSILAENRVRTMVRISRGRDIEAACGQLKGSLIKESL